MSPSLSASLSLHWQVSLSRAAAPACAAVADKAASRRPPTAVARATNKKELEATVAIRFLLLPASASKCPWPTVTSSSMLNRNYGLG
jgi:hypothetical protein